MPTHRHRNPRGDADAPASESAWHCRRAGIGIRVALPTRRYRNPRGNADAPALPIAGTDTGARHRP